MTTQHEPQAATHSRWQFDPFHTQVEFAAKHLGMRRECLSLMLNIFSSLFHDSTKRVNPNQPGSP